MAAVLDPRVDEIPEDLVISDPTPDSKA